METPTQPNSVFYHLPEYISEFIGTAFMVFGGLSAVVFDFGEGLPMSQWIPNHSLRLLITGLCFAATGSLFAISPLGKLSGAHINPSVSLAFWLHGKMRNLDFLFYVIFQMLGGIAGAALLVAVWGKYAASIHNGMTMVGAGWEVWHAFVAEVLITLILVLMIFIFVGDKRLIRWTPVMTWLLVATMVWQEAPISGTSLNPARSFGPALMSGNWENQWIYLLAPPIGGAIGWLLFVLIRQDNAIVFTGKLVYSTNYRTLFRKQTKIPFKPASEI